MASILDSLEQTAVLLKHWPEDVEIFVQARGEGTEIDPDRILFFQNTFMLITSDQKLLRLPSYLGELRKPIIENILRAESALDFLSFTPRQYSRPKSRVLEMAIATSDDFLRFRREDERQVFWLRIDELASIGSALQTLLQEGQKRRLRWLAESGELTDDSAPELSTEARAVAVLLEHPDWSIIRIAKALGICRQTLYKFPRFKAAREARKSRRKGDFPRGSKRDGKIEARDPADP